MLISLNDFFASYGIDATAVAIPMWLDLLSVLIGGLAGVLVAQDLKLDPIGHVALSMLCGLGGGLLRDIILQVGNVYMLSSNYAIPAVVAVGILGFLFPGALRRVPNLLEWIDIFSVGLFVCVGVDKAIVYQQSGMACVLMGVLTGVGGGMMRDVFLGRIPRIFQRDNFYAICALAGSLTYYLCVVNVRLLRGWAAVLCILVTIGLRRLSLHYNLLSPANVDLTPTVARAGRYVYGRTIRRSSRPAEKNKGVCSTTPEGKVLKANGKHKRRLVVLNDTVRNPEKTEPSSNSEH